MENRNIFGIFYFWQGIEMGHFPFGKKFSFVTTNQRNVLLHMIFITSLERLAPKKISIIGEYITQHIFPSAVSEMECLF